MQIGEQSWESAQRDNTSALWKRMVDGVRSGEDSAIAEFHQTYGSGVAVLLRRRLGPVAGERLAKEVLAGALDAIRRGTIREPRDMVRFLNRVLDLHADAAPSEPLLGANDRARIHVKAARVRAVLAGFSVRERELLGRYYGQGADPRTFGVPEAEWEELHGRFLAALKREQAPRPLRHNPPSALARGATA